MGSMPLFYFPMNILVIDVGGTHVKVMAPGQNEPVKIPSEPK